MLTVDIPTHWSPEQAVAVYEFVQDLLQVIWEHYELPLIASLSSEPSEQTPHAQFDLFEFNDDLPF